MKMIVSNEMKHAFVEKRRPMLSPLVLETITYEMVEEFLFNADSVEAFEGLVVAGRNFTVYDEWIGTCDNAEALYHLQLTLVVLTDKGRIKVDVPPNTPLWNEIVDASKIVESVIRISFPRGYLFGLLQGETL